MKSLWCALTVHFLAVGWGCMLGPSGVHSLQVGRVAHEVPQELWRNGSLCGFRVVSEACLGASVAALQATTASPLRVGMVSVPELLAWPGSDYGGSRGSLSRRI